MLIVCIVGQSLAIVEKDFGVKMATLELLQKLTLNSGAHHSVICIAS